MPEAYGFANKSVAETGLPNNLHLIYKEGRKVFLCDIKCKNENYVIGTNDELVYLC